jgi:hypothetical protein
MISQRDETVEKMAEARKMMSRQVGSTDTNRKGKRFPYEGFAFVLGFGNAMYLEKRNVTW